MAKTELRPHAWEKVAFLEDANEDSRLTDAAVRVLHKICAAFNRKEGYAECARTFIVDRVPVTIKTVQRARRLLLAEGRVYIVRKPVGRSSTRYGVNWWYRGADKVRAANGGRAIFDIRVAGTSTPKPATVEGTSVACTDTVEGTSASQTLDTNVLSTTRRGDTVTPKPVNIPQGGDVYNKPAPGTAGGLAAPPAQAVCFEVVEASEGEDEGDILLHLIFRDEAGALHPDSICIESRVQRRQQTGQQRLQELLRAAGLDDIQLADDLVGARCDVLISNDDFEYVPADEIGRRAMGIAA